MKRAWVGTLWIAGIGLLLLTLRAWSLPIGYDDACYFLGIEQWAEKGVHAFPVDTKAGHYIAHSPFLTVGPALYLPIGLWERWTESGVWGARVPMVVFSVLCLLAVKAFFSKALSLRVGLWAAILLLGNIQFLTYGAQYVGEVVAMLWIVLGLYGQAVFWREDVPEAKQNQAFNPLLLCLPFCWNLAILTKQYLALPLGLTLVVAFLLTLHKGHRNSLLGLLVQGTLLPLGSILEIWLSYGSWQTFVEVWEQRSAYSAEFVALTWFEPLRFVFTKPLILMGTLALIIRVRILARSIDKLTLTLHLLLLTFFMIGQGYERFGVLLLFIPAGYAAEWLVAALHRLEHSSMKHKQTKWVVVVAFALTLSYLRGPYILAKDSVNIVQRNENERLTAQWLQNKAGFDQLYTYELQLLPFLPKDVNYQLPRAVPIGASTCESLTLNENRLLVTGPHARFFYAHCYDTTKLHKLAVIGTDEKRYEIWSAKTPIQ